MNDENNENDENNGSMFIDPEILQKEIVISLPILTESDIERMINGEESSAEDSTSDEEEKEKRCHKRDQRRLSLLNNPNYGVVLCFIDKFRSYVNLNYSLRIFEDNILNEQEKISGRFMDFHLALLKKISPGRISGRNDFVSNMAKFAYRFNKNDGDQLDEHGYSKAKIDTKLRILKNLLELQFERNQSLKTAVADKPSFDIRSKPFGRDRFGATYWLFTDTDCFIRLFRENTDADRTWVNLAKNPQELENVIKLLVSDYAVRTKFPDWKFTNESFNNVQPSNKFEQEYEQVNADAKKKMEAINDGIPKTVILGSSVVKTENVDLRPVVNLDREIPISPPGSASALASVPTSAPASTAASAVASPVASPVVPNNDVQMRNSLDETSDQDSIGSEIISGNRLKAPSSSSSASSSPRPSSSSGTREETFHNDLPEGSNDTREATSPNDIPRESNVVLEAPLSNELSQKSNDRREESLSNDSPQESSDSREEPVPNDLPQESNDTLEEPLPNDSSQESNKEPETDNNNTQAVISKPTAEQGIKRKLVDYEDTESDMGSEKNEDLTQESQPVPVKEISKTNADLPIALRRSRRRRNAFMADSSADSSNTNASSSQSSREEKNLHGRWKRSNQSSRSRSRRRRGRKTGSGFSSTTSDERQPSEDDFSDEFLPKDNENVELDKLLTGELLEAAEEEDEGDDFVPRRQAKTVAQCQEQSEVQPKPCTRCSKTDHPELLLLCEDCNDAYHTECVQPELFSIPEDDWYCSLCEHKRLCNGLIEKLDILLKEEIQFDMRRRLMGSKRRKRLTNVTVNLDRFVSPPEIKKPKTTNHRFISSDDDNEDVKPSEKKCNETTDDEKANKKKNNTVIDDDEDSVYGSKNDENRKPSDQEEPEQSGKRRVRACRRKTQNYSYDAYDKKIKDAIIHSGVNSDSVDDDSDDSDKPVFKKKASKKRARYEEDEDFNASDAKNGDADFVPARRRTLNSNSNSRTFDGESPPMTEYIRVAYDHARSDSGNDNNDFDDYGMSDDDTAWRNRRNSNESLITKKKPNSKSNNDKNKNQTRSSLIISDEDTIPYDPNESEITPIINVKSEPTTDFVQNEFPSNVFGKTEIVKNVYNKNRIVENVVYTNEAASINKPKRAPRPKRAAAAKKKKPSKIQEENISDEEEKTRPPPAKRIVRKKRRGSNDSSLDDDDDYEKAVHKRRLFNHGKVIQRSSITGHIKKLLGDEDEDEEEDEEGEEKKENEDGENNPDEPKKDKNNNSKKAKKSQFPEYRLSDDDDFPDEQEILKTTGLLSLKKPASGPKVVPLQTTTFIPPSMPSYQFAMIDPTAQFEFTLPPEEPITEPSDASQAPGDNGQTTAT